jgi:hypothetical protein
MKNVIRFPAVVVAFWVLGTAYPAFGADPPAGVPKDYKLLYSQDFAKPESAAEFRYADPAAWRRIDDGMRPYLEQHRNAKYTPPHRSPVNICLLGGKKFHDLVMDLECQQTGKEYGHRDMVFVFGYQSPAKFYYAHIATKADDHANQVFIVNDAPRTKISKVSNAGNDWGADAWKTVRVVRKASDGTIRVYFDDLTKPVMEARDRTFGTGWVGFGSFDDTCRVRKVTIWGDRAEDAVSPAFPKGK